METTMNTIDRTLPYVDHGKGKSLDAEAWQVEADKATERRNRLNGKTKTEAKS